MLTRPDSALPVSPAAAEGPRRGGFLVASVGSATMSAFRAALAPYEIHPRQFALLRALAATDGQSQQQLSKALHIPPSRVVALVDALEERGLVDRRLHPTDRRTRSLHLTTSGRDILTQLLDAAAQHEQRMFADLSSAERAQLDRLLLRLASALGLAPGEHPGM